MCGTVLDEKTAKFKINFEGETYYFCSASCKKKFKRHPKKSLSNLRFIEIYSLNLFVRIHNNTVIAVNLNSANRGL